MGTISRRSFLAKSATVGMAAIARPAYANIAPLNRAHPLDGIERENIRITDIEVTPLSYVDPTGHLWGHVKRVVWKTDAELCRVYTNQGIIGIGEGTPYAGPDKIKTYTETVLKPMRLDRALS